MFSVIKSCSQGLQDYLVKNYETGVDVFEFRDLLARFSTNIISSVAFGIDNDCINEPNNIFRTIGAKLFKPNLRNGFRGMIQILMPKMFFKLGLRTVDADVEEFLFSIVKQTVEFREQNNFTRNDLMQQLIQLKNQGYVSVDSKSEIDKNDEEIATKLTINEVVAQCLVFYVAGFETTSSTMSFCLFELARNPEALKKVQAEVDNVFKTAGPEGVSYDMLDKLTYLDCCINETMRLYPSLPFLFRECSKDYNVPDSKLVIHEGTTVFISLMGLHRDPDIFKNPLQFKPEIFLNSSNGNGNSEGLFYMPFGDGPRICIGMRMGKLTVKLGLSMILSKFNVELTDKEMMNEVLEFHPNQAILNPLKPFNLKITTR